jgi:hypothetical protein
VLRNDPHYRRRELFFAFFFDRVAGITFLAAFLTVPLADFAAFFNELFILL